MKKYIFSSNKFISVCILLFIAFIVIIFSSNTYTASAMSATEVYPCDFNSGIVFDIYEDIGIKKQVLDVTFNEDLIASVSSKYILKNHSNRSLNIESRFLLSAIFGEDKDITIEKNGESIDFCQGFYDVCETYDCEHTRTSEEWQSGLIDMQNKRYPLGEGGGFFEYCITKEGGDGELYAEFMPKGSYFCNTSNYGYTNYSGSGSHILNSRNYYGDDREHEIVVVSRQNINFDTNGKIDKKGIDNIYDYLFDKARRDTESENVQFAAEQFNRYLADIDYDNSSYIHSYDFFDFTQQGAYISFIKFFLDFEPFEQIELNVSYSCLLGNWQALGAEGLIFDYYLSPAKFTQGFESFEINLTLYKEYKKSDMRPIKLTKTSDKTYGYVSETMPDNNLKFEFENSTNFFLKLFLIILAVFLLIIFLVGFIAKSLIKAVIDIIVRLCKKK